MRYGITGAAALSISMGFTAMAQGGPPEGVQLPPGVAAQINLGSSGLLEPFYSDEQFGTVQGRIGQGRATIGAAGAPFAPETGYRDETTAVIGSFTALRALEGGRSYLRASVTGTFVDGEPNLVELDGEIGRLDVQVMSSPDTDTLLAFGAFVERSTLDIVGAGNVARSGAGIRGDLVSKLTDTLGFAGRAEYSFGETELEVAAGPATVRQEQGDDRLYIQGEFVGNYRNSEIGLVPNGWVFRPIAGAQFQRNFLEATADSFGEVSSGVVGDDEDYATVWAKLRLERDARPGRWAPNVMLGLEHEVVNDLDGIVEDRTYGLFGVGVSNMLAANRRIDLAYTRHEGLEGNRWDQSLVAAFTLTF